MIRSGAWFDDIALSCSLSLIRSVTGYRNCRLVVYRGTACGQLVVYRVVKPIEEVLPTVYGPETPGYDPPNPANDYNMPDELSTFVPAVGDISVVLNGGSFVEDGRFNHFDVALLDPLRWTGAELGEWAVGVCDVAEGNADLLRTVFAQHVQSVQNFLVMDRNQLLGHLAAWEGIADTAVTTLLVSEQYLGIGRVHAVHIYIFCCGQHVRDRMYWRELIDRRI